MYSYIFIMLNQVKTYIAAHHLLKKTDLILVGLSGGADSVALLSLLTRLGYRCIAVHCNFHLRGEESDRDEDFAGKMAEKAGIPFLKTDFDTRQYAKENHISIEMAARDLRYAWFEEVRQSQKAQAIAIAHHQDDSIETFLLNLTRGTGIRGLRGIQPKNGYVIRPLLSVNRLDIMDYLGENDLPYVTDSTNNQDDISRNFIRLRVLPLLQKLNPSIKKAIATTSQNLSEAEILYQYAIEKIKEKVMDPEGRYSIPALAQYPAQQTVLYELLSPFGFTAPTIESVYHSLDAEPGKRFYSLNKRYCLLKDRGHLILSKEEKKNKKVYPVPTEGMLTEPVNISTRLITANEFNSKELKNINTAYIDYDKLNAPLTLRTWRAGDWFIPFGMNGRKKLSDYFSDHKFSRIQKDQTWLLCAGQDIIWIVGERSDNRFRVSFATKTILMVKFSH